MVESNTPPGRGGGPATAVDPLIGRIFNERFRILEPVGAGGMGKVYKAVQQPLERLVALKVLNPDYGGGKDPGFQQRFFLEASVTSKLRHPNTVTVIDYGKTEDGIFYIAMEYLEGLTLAQVLTQTGALPWVRALNIGQQIARSLREAHKAGVVHRDLKPANVMLLSEESDNDVVKVLDFGLVKAPMPGQDAGAPDPALTQAGIILGSPQYMAPEQARNVSDARSDVYSLGVVLFQMLVGKPPFQSQQSIDVILKHLNQAPPSFAQLWPTHQVPPEVEALVRKCLEKAPAKRFQSMDELLEALRRASAASGYSGLQTQPRAAGMPPHSGAMAQPSGLNSGVFSGVRPVPAQPPHASGVHSGPRSPVASGAHPSVSGARRSGPYAAPATSTSGVIAMGVEPEGTGKKLGLVAGAVGAVLVLGAVAFVALKPGAKPAPAPAAEQHATGAAQEPAHEAAPAAAQPTTAAASPAEEPTTQAAVGPVRFVVQTEPRGATVLLGKRVLGESPLEFDLPADAEGRASAELTFVLDGYQRLTATARGQGPEVKVSERLKKEASRPAPAPAPAKKDSPKTPGSPGYKDDPYQ